MKILDPKKTALLLIDIQNDFMPGGALAVSGGDEIIPLVNKLAGFFPLTIATMDFHPKGHKSFASSHAGKKIGEFIQLSGKNQILWPDHCVQGTSGADLVKGLTARIDQVVFKGTNPEVDSYSGFFDNDHRSATTLDAFLKEKAVSELVIVGLATDYCVKFTALDAAALGYKTTVLEDACRAVNLFPKDGKKAATEMMAAGVQVMNSQQFLTK